MSEGMVCVRCGKLSKQPIVFQRQVFCSPDCFPFTTLGQDVIPPGGFQEWRGRKVNMRLANFVAVANGKVHVCFEDGDWEESVPFPQDDNPEPDHIIVKE